MIGRYEVLRALEGHSRALHLGCLAGDSARRLVILAAVNLPPEHAHLLADGIERCRRPPHAAIMPIVDVLEHEGSIVLAYASGEGVALADLMAHLEREQERLADGAAIHVGQTLFDALAAAHQHADPSGKTTPMVHGRLGPHQIWLTPEGEVKILGFGMLHAYRLDPNAAPEPAQAIPFRAPELAAGEPPSERSNVYAAAAMLWSLLAHQAPATSGGRIPLLAQIRPELPRLLVHSIDQALEPDPRRRAITGRELAGLLLPHASAAGKRELQWNVEMLLNVGIAGGGARGGSITAASPAASVQPLRSDPPTMVAGDEEMATIAQPEGVLLQPSSAEPLPRHQAPDRRVAPAPRAAVPRATEPEKPAAPASPAESPRAAAPRATEPEKPAAPASPAESPPAVKAEKPVATAPQQSAPPAPAPRPTKPERPVGLAQRAESPRAHAPRIAARAAVVAPASSAEPPSSAPRGMIPGAALTRQPNEEPPPALAPRRVERATPTQASSPAARDRFRPGPQPDERKGPAEQAAGPVQSKASSSTGPRAVAAGGSLVFTPYVAPGTHKTGRRARGMTMRGLTGWADEQDWSREGANQVVVEGSPAEEPASTRGTSERTEGKAEHERTEPGGPRVRAEPERSDAGPDPEAALGPSAPESPPPDAPPTFGSVREPAAPGAAREWSASAPVPAPRADTLDGGSPPLSASRGRIGIARAAAITGIAFAVGLVVGVGPLRTLVGTEECAPVEASAMSARPCQPDDQRLAAAPTTAPSSPSSDASTDLAPAATATSSAEARADEDDGSKLPAHLGYLLVHSSVENAYVYLAGRPAGPIGERLRVRCAVLPVRLGTKPLRKWLGPVKSVKVACRSVTTVDMDAAQPPARPAARAPSRPPKASSPPRGSRYVPSDL